MTFMSFAEAAASMQGYLWWLALHCLADLVLDVTGENCQPGLT